MRFSITTLGCKVNSYESNYYKEQLEKHGHQMVETNSPCDVCIINTCTVTNTAAAKSRQKIHSLKKTHPNALIVVVGCYVQHANQTERENLDVDLIIGANHKNELVQRIEELLKDHVRKDLVEDIRDFTSFEEMPIHVYESKHRAFLKIEDGCNQFCSYCAIPYARGRQRSLSKEKVIEIAQSLSDKGHYEIVLTGIHTGRYQDGDTTLTKLLKELLEKTDERVQYRISSIEITEVDDELIELMKQTTRICRHLHIPIQSGCNETLQRMNRPYTIEEFKQRLDHIRKEIPDISISTDVIVGFVQESEEEFETTYKNLEDCAFSFLHVFPYSKRNGTAASRMKGEVHGSIVKERVNKLLALSNKLRQNDMERFTNLEVLIEKQDQDGVYHGYCQQYHPVKIYSDVPLSTRIHVTWDEIKDHTYIVLKKEGSLCD
ncbi:MAG: tRNA (N(6)-L-threonylcarbamoyladenosine(37)-C(2))-methylthiotransferase MtaB [Faecalicoccus sp.]|uniref:tRNA (N(6)-L-threonylcarbamoyladenosine(37)-C(2))- methylthiotransferase MtaB n=1 Tax=Faecalicoccus sp. TaxID=1971758 RepID=UPI002F93AD76